MIYILLILLVCIYFLFIVKYSIYEKFDNEEVPKIIWSYWDDDNIPEFINICYKNWVKFAPNYQVNLLTKSNAEKYLDINYDGWKELPAYRQSDIIRLLLLKKYGGVWIDASTFLLDNPDNFIHKNNLTLFTTPRTNKDDPVYENWFISAPKNNIIISKWTDEVIDGLKKQKKYIEESPIDNVIIVRNPWYLFCHMVLRNIYTENKELFKDIKVIDCKDTAFFNIINMVGKMLE